MRGHFPWATWPWTLGLVLLASIMTRDGAAQGQDLDTTATRAWQVSAAYTGEYLRNARGGLETGGAYLDNLDLQLAIDGERAFGVPGLSAFVYGLYNNGGSISGRYVGDIHAVSNIEAVRALRLYEAWVDWQPSRRRELSLRLGLYDVNSEFDSSEVSGLFINGTHGMGIDFSQAGLNGPSIFPFTSLALRLQARWREGWSARFAVLDGVPQDPQHPAATRIRLGGADGALYAAEVAHEGSGRRVVLGHWHFTTDFDDLALVDASGQPLRHSGSHGSYAFVEGDLWRPADTGRRLQGVLRLGVASADVNPVQRSLRVGLVLDEPFVDGVADQLGVALAVARYGEPYLLGSAGAGARRLRSETNVELTYRVAPTGWLTLQPNLQWVINPAGEPGIADAWVLGLRFEVRGASH